jgi:hypothetical protein
MKPGQEDRLAAADALNSSSSAALAGPENEPVSSTRRSTSIPVNRSSGHSSKECMLSLAAVSAIREDLTI